MPKHISAAALRRKLARMDLQDAMREGDRVTGKPRFMYEHGSLPDPNSTRLQVRLNLASLGISAEQIDKCMAAICRHDKIQRHCIQCQRIK